MQKKESVNKELAEVEPALEDAKKNVKNLDNKSLRELQSYKQPPPAVKITLEAVCTLT